MKPTILVLFSAAMFVLALAGAIELFEPRATLQDAPAPVDERYRQFAGPVWGAE